MSKPLWSGRFDSAPDPAAFDFGVSFPFDRRLFEDDVTGSLAWADALARAGVLDAADTQAITSRPAGDSRAGPRRPGVGQRRRRGRALVRRAPTGRARRRCRPAPAHRPIAQRAGLGRSAAVPAPPHSAPAGQAARHHRRVCRSGRAGRRRADAVLHAHATRHAGAGVAFPDEPCRAAAARSRSPRGRACRSRRADARIGRDRRHRLRRRHPFARRHARLQPRRRQQHGRLVRSRLRRDASCTPSRCRWCTCRASPKTSS